MLSVMLTGFDNNDHLIKSGNCLTASSSHPCADMIEYNDYENSPR